MNIQLTHFLRRIQFVWKDHSKLNRLNELLQAKSQRATHEYLHDAIKSKRIDPYFLGYFLTANVLKDPDRHESLWKDFVHYTGSQNGHGRFNSDFGPLFWLGYFTQEHFEARFVLNHRCFIAVNIRLRIDIESENDDFAIRGAKYSCIKNEEPKTKSYQLHLSPGRNGQIGFTLSTQSQCRVKIYHMGRFGQVLLANEKFSALDRK